MFQLVEHFRTSDPWMENSAPCNSVILDSGVKKPREFSDEELEEELFRLYLDTRFQPRCAYDYVHRTYVSTSCFRNKGLS